MIRVSFAIFMIVFLVACRDGDKEIQEKFKTQDKFRCRPHVDLNRFRRDSLLLAKSILSLIENREGIYGVIKYDKKSVVYIDTILYDPNKKHAALLVIIHCYEPYSKEMVYDGFAQFARLDSLPNDSLMWRIFSYHGARHINSETYAKMSGILRFRNFVGRQYEGHIHSRTKYNLDDCRFWESTLFVDTIQTSPVY